MWNLVYLFTGLIFVSILIIIYFSKQRIKTKETKIFKYLIIINLIGFLIEIILQFLVLYFRNMEVLSTIFGKLYLIYLYVWFGIFSIYTFLISYIDRENIDNISEYRLIKTTHIAAIIFGIIAILIMPMKKYYSLETGNMYTYGLAVTFIKVSLSIYIIVWATRLLINIKKIKEKRNYSIIATIILLFINVIIQSINPSILIATVTMTITCYILFFTIENPDLIMLAEYNRNRELVATNIEDKANMLFKISEEVKSPLRKIKSLENNILKTDNVREIHENAKNIDKIANDLMNTVDYIMDISTIDKSKIKIMNSKYDMYNLFKQIIFIVKNKTNSEINLKYSINSVVPEKLFGDSSKLKQIICSLILTSFQNDQSGIVDLDINAIVHHDVCRLIITINATNKEMNIENINDILESDINIQENEFDDVDNLDMDIKVIKKVITLMGGILLIKSNENEGTTYTVVMNQLIDKNEIKKDEDNFLKVLSNKKRVLLVEDNYKYLKKLSSEFKKYNYEVITTMYGKDCLDRINNNEKYDLICIDDEMDGYNAVQTIEKISIKKLKNTKILIMLNKDKEGIKDHYLRDYAFNDYLLKNNYKEEIKRISNKY